MSFESAVPAHPSLDTTALIHPDAMEIDLPPGGGAEPGSRSPILGESEECSCHEPLFPYTHLSAAEAVSRYLTFSNGKPGSSDLSALIGPVHQTATAILVAAAYATDPPVRPPATGPVPAIDRTHASGVLRITATLRAQVSALVTAVAKVADLYDGPVTEFGNDPAVSSGALAALGRVRIRVTEMADAVLVLRTAGDKLGRLVRRMGACGDRIGRPEVGTWPDGASVPRVGQTPLWTVQDADRAFGQLEVDVLECVDEIADAVGSVRTACERVGAAEALAVPALRPFL